MADKSQIRNTSAFDEKKVQDVEYPLYLDKKLAHHWEKSTIDIVGWSSFKRLVLID